MIKTRRNILIKKLGWNTLFAVVASVIQLFYLCTVNYTFVNGNGEAMVLGKIHPTDLDLDWYVIDFTESEYDKIKVPDDHEERLRFFRGQYDPPFVERSDESCFAQSVDFTVPPYKLHIIKCEMADTESRLKGLNITIDSYMDADEVEHKKDCVLFYEWQGKNVTYGLLNECYKKYVAERFGTCNIPVIKLLPYMPISEYDPYVGGYYKYWSDYMVHVKVVLILYVAFSILAVLDKPESFKYVEIFGGLSFFYSVWFLLLTITYK